MIRIAEEKDVPAIFELIKALAVFEKLEHEFVATIPLLRESLFGTRPFAEALVAEKDGQTIGFALFFHTFSTFLAKPGLYLEDLFVLPEFRGQGFGVQLLRHVGKIAEDRGCGRLEWSVLDWNKKAIDLYLSLGSKSLDDWTVHRLTGQGLKDFAYPPTEK